MSAVRRTVTFSIFSIPFAVAAVLLANGSMMMLKPYVARYIGRAMRLAGKGLVFAQNQSPT